MALEKPGAHYGASVRTSSNYESISSNEIVVGPTVPDTKLLLEVGSKLAYTVF
jgi:hypothetical protein